MNADSKLIKTQIFFQGFCFVLETEELFKGKQAIPLQPLAGKLLGLLIKNKDTLLTREVIQNHLWPETLVDYDYRINALIKDIRKILGDDLSEPRFIETISKKGYRFKALTTNGRGKPFRPTAGGSLVKLLGAFAVFSLVFFLITLYFKTKENPVLLILPVQNLENETSIPFLADNLTNQLISRASIQGEGALWVIARTSAMKFKNSNLTASEIAEVFNADYVLEVSLSQTLTKIIVISALIDPKTDQQIWTHTFEKAGNNLFALDQEIVGTVLERLEISGPKKVTAASGLYIPGDAAYKAYLKGLYLINQADDDEKFKSVPFFQKAIENDPDFALPHYQIARFLRSQGAPKEEILQSVEQALLHDNNLADAYYLRAFIYLFEYWDWDAAGADFLKALKIEPTRARFSVGYSYFLGTLGRSEEAREIAEKTFLLDPLSSVVNSDLGWIYLRLKDYDQAIVQGNRLLEISPDNSNAFNILLIAHTAKNDLKKAGNIVVRMLKSEGASDKYISTVVDLSPSEQTSKIFEWRLESNLPQKNEANYNSFMALNYLGIRNFNMALDFFEIALQEREQFMVNFMVDPRLEPLRNHPRYLEIFEKIRRP